MDMKRGIAVFLSAAVLFGITSAPVYASHRPVVIHRVPEGKPEVRIFSPSGELRTQFTPQEVVSHRNLTLAVGDVLGDDRDEIIIGQGTGAPPLVYVYTSEGELLRNFFVYPEAFRGGVRVTVADLNGDGKDEIITAPGLGGGPHVRVFDGAGDVVFTPGFFATDKSMRDGLFVGTIDTDGNNERDIVVSLGQGNPSIRIFDRFGNFLRAFAPSGVDAPSGNVATGFDADRSGKERFVVVPRGKAGGAVHLYNGSEDAVGQSFVPYSELTSPLNIAPFDLDGDKNDDLIVSAGFLGSSRVRGFNASGTARSSLDFFAFDKDFIGGVVVGVGDVTGDRVPEIVAMQENLPESKEGAGKLIEVDLSEQTLYAFERGFLKAAYLISSGKAPLGTPEGRFKIDRKKPLTRMAWVYGVDHPKNYDLPNVPWMMAFLGPYTIHGTYWHSNFGHPMSHGCVNMRTSEVKLLYEWAPMGTPVWVHQ
ncbi:MAG: L,D-transpeptidase family protein [bacterium]|nr:L,D-transpeptidase family protein [bacterium]